MVVDAELSRSKVDEHVFGAGTTLRFVLLLVLISASGGMMISDLLQAWADPDNNQIGCRLASGWDPSGQYGANMMSAIGHNHESFEACIANYQPAWWAPGLMIVLLVVAAAALYVWLPFWKGRRGRVVPLEKIDPQGNLHRRLTNLVSVAGLRHAPRFVVDPAAATTSAVVFGHPRRYTVCLHGGLVARRVADKEGFRAVVLHELAHIRNGDVRITYATVALWRVFLVGVLLPSVISELKLLFSGLFLRTDSVFWVDWPETAPENARAVLLTIFTVALVYLSRADLLRSRETYADLTALHWGAAPKSWQHGGASAAARGSIRRTIGSFTELWRTHPRWDLREQLLTDSSALFGLQAVPMFLTGAATALVATTGAVSMVEVSGTE
ncbi:MAG: M48 family metalloprotease [Pseudonocardiaceae bacterium]